MIPSDWQPPLSANAVPPKPGPRRVLLTLHTYGQSFIQLPQILQAAGVEVDLVAHEGNPLLDSRSLHRSFSSTNKPGAFATMVEERLQTGEYRLLINGDEDALIALYEHGLPAELQSYLPYPMDSGLGRAVGRKDVFQKWCESENIAAPLTRIAQTSEEIAGAATVVGFPFYLKRSSGSGGQTVFRIERPEDLESHATPMENEAHALVQQEVQGRAGCVLFFADRGEVLARFGLRFIVCMNDGKGPMAVGGFMDSPELEAVTRQVARSIGITGLTGFDFIENAEGKIYVIDSHLGRTTAANHFGKWCGVRMGEVVRRWLDGEENIRVAPESTETRVVKFPEVIDLLFQNGTRALSGCGPVKIAWGSLADWQLIIRLGWGTLIGNLRVAGGRWRKQS